MKYKVIIKNLPDVHSYNKLSSNIIEYGRFGYTTSKYFFVSDIYSSHPNNTLIGGYYAITNKNELLLSPRGSFNGFSEFIDNIIENKDIYKLIKRK